MCVAAFVGLLAVASLAWGVTVYRQRLDTDRCPKFPAALNYHATEVNVGGWGASDECSYEDAQGQRVSPDGALARPARTTPFINFAIPGFFVAGLAAAWIGRNLGRTPPVVRANHA